MRKIVIFNISSYVMYLFCTEHRSLNISMYCYYLLKNKSVQSFSFCMLSFTICVIYVSNIFYYFISHCGQSTLSSLPVCPTIIYYYYYLVKKH